jgi:hypothetical protein
MAKDNIRYRYPTYLDDASVGGYNRKELRGLNRQAKSGTLTQRERARLKYLTDERKGRRKRGLLAGLGGAAATLGGLALAGKLGKGEGGGGAALMDAIKSRLAEGKEKRVEKRARKSADPMEEISSLGVPKNVREEMELVSGGNDFAKKVARDLASKISTEKPEGPYSIPNIDEIAGGRDSRFFKPDEFGYTGGYDEFGEPLDEEAKKEAEEKANYGRLDGFSRADSAYANPEMMSSGEYLDTVRGIIKNDEKVDDLLKILSSTGDRGAAQYNPNEVAAPDRLMPRFGSRSQGNPNLNLPQLEALEQLRKFFGNRYN